VVQLVVVQPEPVPLAVAPLVAVLQASVQHAARPALPEEPWMVAAQQVEGQAVAGAKLQQAPAALTLAVLAPAVLVPVVMLLEGPVLRSVICATIPCTPRSSCS